MNLIHSKKHNQNSKIGGNLMYTLVLRQKNKELAIFDVFKTTLLGRQKIIGNFFCIKDENGDYKTTTSIYMASCPQQSSVHWDGGKLDFYLKEKALHILNVLIDNKEE